MGQAPVRPRPRREVAYEPLPSQAAFHALRTRYKGFSGPVGSGKSLAFCQEALRLAYANPGCLGLIAAPTFAMLRDVTRLAFLEILDGNGIPHKFRKQENSVHLLEPDTKIVFRSMDQPERSRGTNLAFFGIDELTYCKPQAWSRLQGRLRGRRAKERCGFAVWTPKGFDWVYKRFVTNDGKKPELFGCIRAKPFENRRNNGEDYYESLETYDERFYKQEVEGEYLNVHSGAVYYTFDRKVHLAPVEFDPNYPLIWSLDFNIDPMCSVLGQVVDTTTQDEARAGKRSHVLHVIDEIALPDARTITAVRAFLGRIAEIEKHGHQVKAIHLHGDASGAAGHSSSQDSDWGTVKRELARGMKCPILYRVLNKNPLVRTRTQAMCGQLRDNRGDVRMLINPRCGELVKDLEEVVWKRELSGRPLDEIDKKDPSRTHLSDALGYAVHWIRLAPGGEQSNVLI